MNKKPIQYEELMCKAFIKQLTLDPSLRKYCKSIFHIPNGGKRSAATGAKLKAMGVMKGVADYKVMKVSPKIIIYGASNGPVIISKNLYLEFKHGANNQSFEQKEFEKMVTSCGHAYKVVRSIDEAINAIKEFWGDK